MRMTCADCDSDLDILSERTRRDGEEWWLELVCEPRGAECDHERNRPEPAPWERVGFREKTIEKRRRKTR